jgi:hypothetical protein
MNREESTEESLGIRFSGPKFDARLREWKE